MGWPSKAHLELLRPNCLVLAERRKWRGVRGSIPGRWQGSTATSPPRQLSDLVQEKFFMIYISRFSNRTGQPSSPTGDPVNQELKRFSGRSGFFHYARDAGLMPNTTLSVRLFGWEKFSIPVLINLREKFKICVMKITIWSNFVIYSQIVWD